MRPYLKWTPAEDDRLSAAYLRGGIDAARKAFPDRTDASVNGRVFVLRSKGRIPDAKASVPSAAPAAAERATPAAWAENLDPVPTDLEKLPWIKWPSDNRPALEEFARSLRDARAVSVENGRASSADLFDQHLAYAEALLKRLAQKEERLAKAVA